MVDLHGAPGSQNGFDNSGLRGTRQWFANSTNTQRTIQALQTLTSEFAQATYNKTVIAIELINEPFPYTTDEANTLRGFYQSAYSAVRESSSLVVALDDGFLGLQTWQGFMEEPDYGNVAMDTVSEMGDGADDSISTRCE